MRFKPGDRIIVRTSSPLKEARGRCGTVIPDDRPEGTAVVLDGDQTILLDDEITALPPDLDWKNGDAPSVNDKEGAREWDGRLQALAGLAQ